MKAAPARIPAWGVLAGAAYSLFYAPVQRKLLSSPGAEEDESSDQHGSGAHDYKHDQPHREPFGLRGRRGNRGG